MVRSVSFIISFISLIDGLVDLDDSTFKSCKDDCGERLGDTGEEDRGGLKGAGETVEAIEEVEEVAGERLGDTGEAEEAIEEAIGEATEEED